MRKLAGLCALMTAGAIGMAHAGPENVAFPKDYASSFVAYHAVDKPDKKRGPTHRVFFINREALAAVKAGKPLPSGTVIIREDWFVKTDDTKTAVKDAGGRFVRTEKKGVQVMEKRDGWGADYPPAMRNGNWEYASFKADGSRNAKANIERCFSCHARMRDDDFVFSMKELRAAANK